MCDFLSCKILIGGHKGPSLRLARGPYRNYPHIYIYNPSISCAYVHSFCLLIKFSAVFWSGPKVTAES